MMIKNTSPQEEDLSLENKQPARRVCGLKEVNQD